METKLREIGIKEYLCILIISLIITDLAILLNILFLRQIVGFIFLTILPGLLIIQILKLNKLEFTEKFVLLVGLSVSFLMFFGLLINNLSLSLDYETPLSTISLLISFNIALIVFAIIAYRTNKDKVFFLPNFKLSASEKAFLVVPIFFPALSIFGMNLMNTTDNNIILMFLLLSIPAYIAFVCFFDYKFSKRMYPVVIFLISISLLLLLSLRSNHIIGIDTHLEYYLFRTTLDNLHWRVLIVGNALDACLSISILPTIYQSLLNISPEFLFRILYSLLYSISPLVIYVISKKYVEERYAFLASCFFMFQLNFLLTEYNARTNIAILFFALATMTLFSDKIDPLKKRILFIIFMASWIVSHYSTTYIVFFILLGAFVGIEILSKKYLLKKVVSLTIVLLSFAFIFFWYSQVTETAFNAGVGFIENTLTNLNGFFVEESRSEHISTMFGKGVEQKEIPQKIEFVFTWLTFAFIGIGVITLIRRYKEMSFPELNFKKPDFLKDKFEVTYFMIALACVGLLVMLAALPYLSKGYNMDRLYGLVITILSVFFVIGGITLVKHFFFLQKTLLLRKSLYGKFASQKGCAKRKSFDQNASQVWAYLIILLVLIPYFFCVTGVMYSIFGDPRQIILNSEGVQYNNMYIHDQDSYAGKWFGKNYVKQGIYAAYVADGGGSRALRSQGIFSRRSINSWSFREHEDINGFIYLRYYNVVNGLVLGVHNSTEMTEYSGMFVGKNKVYDNGGSEVWR